MTTKQQILEWEGRYARPVAIASVAGALLFFASLMIESFANLTDNTNDAKQLLVYHDHVTPLFGTALMRAIGSLLLVAPFFYLFTAARVRSDRVRPYFIAFAFIGPVLLAAQSIVYWAGSKQVAQQFVDQAGGALNGNLAHNLIQDSNTLKAASSIGIPAILGILIALVYISMSAMRVGLLSRFAGSVGIGLGASIILLGPFALLAMLVWIIYVGMMIGGWLPSGRPPAWQTGEPMPWPRPGEESPAYLEAIGREVPEGGPPEIEAPEPQPEAAGEGLATSGETQGQRRKKRKRRS